MMKTLSNAVNRSFSEKLNPVYVKELRQTLNGKAIWVELLVLLAAELICAYMRVYSEGEGSWHDDGIKVFSLYFFVCWMVIAVPALTSASRWVYERSQDSLTPEYTTALSAYKILNGKLAACLTETLLLAAVSVPTFLYLASGAIWEKLDPFVFVPAIALLALNMTLSLLLGSLLSAKKLPSSVLHVVLFFPLVDMLFSCGAIFSDMRYPRQTHDLGSITATWFAVIYVYTLSIARIMPENSNRMLLPRLVGALLCAVAFPVLYLVREGGGDNKLWDVLLASGILIGAYAFINLAIAALERLKISDRCREELPKNPVARAVIRFFSSGAYNGVVYGVVCLAVGTVMIGYSDGHIPGLTRTLWASPLWYVLFYTLVTLIIRNFQPRNNPVVIMCTVYVFCNVVATTSIVDPNGTLAMLSFSSNYFLEGWNQLLVPLGLCGAALAVLIAQAAVFKFREAASAKK